MIPIEFGQRIERRIDPVGENEIYTFEAVAGDLMRLFTTRLSEVDPGFLLFNPDGTFLDAITFDSENTNFFLLSLIVNFS